MSGFLALLKRELRSITKEKTIMFAIIVQFFIASLSSIIMVGIMAFWISQIFAGILAQSAARR